MVLFRWISEPSLSPLKNGLFLSVLNLCLLASFGITMGVLLLDPIGVAGYIKPWMVFLAFVFISVGLWYQFGAVLPSSHSLGQVFMVCVIGLLPVVLAMGYEGTITDSVGCGGAEATGFILGSGAMVGETIAVFWGNIFGYRKTVGVPRP
ncbi:MAG: hypothetical protein HY694_03775 [Deltaproteobacteria bacterium]|nr:hypothetical protein [Deltaproteobacteria bacterium]